MVSCTATQPPTQNWHKDSELDNETDIFGEGMPVDRKRATKC